MSFYVCKTSIPFGILKKTSFLLLPLEKFCENLGYLVRLNSERFWDLILGTCLGVVHKWCPIFRGEGVWCCVTLSYKIKNLIFSGFLGFFVNYYMLYEGVGSKIHEKICKKGWKGSKTPYFSMIWTKTFSTCAWMYTVSICRCWFLELHGVPYSTLPYSPINRPQLWCFIHYNTSTMKKS